MIYIKDESEKKTNTDDFGKSNFFPFRLASSQQRECSECSALGQLSGS